MISERNKQLLRYRRSFSTDASNEHALHPSFNTAENVSVRKTQNRRDADLNGMLFYSSETGSGSILFHKKIHFVNAKSLYPGRAFLTGHICTQRPQDIFIKSSVATWRLRLKRKPQCTRCLKKRCSVTGPADSREDVNTTHRPRRACRLRIHRHLHAQLSCIHPLPRVHHIHRRSGLKRDEEPSVVCLHKKLTLYEGQGYTQIQL